MDQAINCTDLVMHYRATKIRLICDERDVREWASYMCEHLNEVSFSLRNEGVRHEMWFLGRADSLFVIGVMDVDDITASSAVAADSELSIDVMHRRFKRYWDRTGIEDLRIDPLSIPQFDDCELLFEARS